MPVTLQNNDKTESGTEFWRRLILLSAVCIAVCMAMSVSLSPLIAVEAVDFAHKQKHPRSVPVMTGEEKHLASLPLSEYIDKITEGKRISVKGEDWRDFFDKASGILGTSSEHLAATPEWKHRISHEYSTVYAIWFRPDESPLNMLEEDLVRLFHKKQDIAYLCVRDDKETRYLLLRYLSYSADDFPAFLGFSGNRPPRYFFTPLRIYAPVPAVIGLSVYIFLPWGKRRAEDIYCARWRVILGDVVSMMLFVPFYWLPFLVGGPVQTFGNWWGLALLFWSFAYMAVYLCAVMSDYAEFFIRLRDGGFDIHRGNHIQRIDYSSLETVQPAILIPPRWLTIAAAIAKYMGKGVRLYRYGGIAFTFKDGQQFFLWNTDQMGSSAFEGMAKFNAALKAAGVSRSRQVVEKSGIGAETDMRKLFYFFAIPVFVFAGFAIVGV